MRNLRNSKGFTLIELMIVVVIIGILAAIAIPKFTEVSKNAKQSEADPTLKQISTLQESYHQRYDIYQADITKLSGYENPQAKYFDFTVTAGTTTAMCAKATPNAAGTAAGLTPMYIKGTKPSAAGDGVPTSTAC